MAIKFQIDGLAELRAALRRLPEEMSHEASAIVMAHAEEAARRIGAGYPQGPTGNLKRRITVERTTARAAAMGVVRARAPHAWIFERGTRKRRTNTGANRGAMPAARAGQAAIPVFQRVRRNMTKALVQLVRRAGFQVEEP